MAAQTTFTCKPCECGGHPECLTCIRANVTKLARKNGVPCSGLDHQEDMTFVRVVAYRTMQSTIARAKELLSLLEADEAMYFAGGDDVIEATECLDEEFLRVIRELRSKIENF